MDKGLWITWYDLPEEGRDTYLSWLHETYIPGFLKRPGFLWAAHYASIQKGTMTHARKDPLKHTDDAAVPAGDRYILLFGAEHAHVFGSPVPSALNQDLPQQSSKMLAMRIGERVNIMTEAARVEGPAAKDYPHGMALPPCIQLGSFNCAWRDEEDMLAWYAQWRMPAMVTLPGMIRTRKLASVSGWAKHAVMYEWLSLEARNDYFPKHEDGNPKMRAWSDKVVQTLQHAPRIGQCRVPDMAAGERMISAKCIGASTGLLLHAALWLPIAGSQAADNAYPTRPIRIVVPQSPGGASDFNARLVAPLLAERLGQSVVIDNRPGAGTIVGTDLVAKASPDGYTLLVVPSSFTITPSMYKNVPFDTVQDFAPVTTLSSYPYVVTAHPTVAANSVKELIALAKAKPGTLNFASGGVGTGTHLDGELFKFTAGIALVHVPYKGGGPAVSALLGGQVQLHFASILPVLGHIKTGKLKALAVTSAKRSALMPEMPTVAESGLPGYEHIGWAGMLAPARTSPTIVKKLNDEVNALLKIPATRERFMADGSEPGGISSEEFAARIKNEVPKWRKVISQAGINPE